MTTNYERIKNMTMDEMAEFSIMEFWTRNEEGNKRLRYKVGLDGNPYHTWKELIEGNLKWLEAESEE